jgi:isopropylmalate/homocitrate/citramalate synthase
VITAPDPSKVWVSELNAAPEVRKPFAGLGPVRFYDATLRDGEQTVGVVLSPQQKLEIARALDQLGVARIEAGFPRVSAEDAEAITLIQKAGLKAEVWGFSRAVAADIDELLRLGVQFSVIEAPTSAIKMRAYGMNPEQILSRVQASVSHAAKAGIRVAFFAVDGTRTELPFLREVYSRALDAGAKELVIVDTIGACGPEAAESLVRQVRDWVGQGIPLHWHGHNDFGLATASAIAAVRAGAEWIQGTVNGMGERAGNADNGEIALALACLYGVAVEMDLTQLRAVSKTVREASRYELEPWKPAIGENLFVRESGAVASQFHIPEAIEPYAADLVGAQRGVVLGKKSGLDSIDLKASELGLTVAPEMRAPLLAEVKRRSIEKAGLITDDEFREAIRNLSGAAAKSAQQ